MQKDKNPFFPIIRSKNSSCRVSRYRLYERNVRNLSIDKNI